MLRVLQQLQKLIFTFARRRYSQTDRIIQYKKFL